MTEFQTKGYVFVKDFMDSESILDVSRYMEYLLKRKSTHTSDSISTYSFYADPLIETILYNARDQLEYITGLELYPTYSYARVYLKKDELKCHTDRPACEISVTCNVATVGEPWPIFIQMPGQDPVKFILGPGDAIVYRGIEAKHWRETNINTEINAQFMLHYVDSNGKHTSYKYDKRESLGMPLKE